MNRRLRRDRPPDGTVDTCRNQDCRAWIIYQSAAGGWIHQDTQKFLCDLTRMGDDRVARPMNWPE